MTNGSRKAKTSKKNKVFLKDMKSSPSTLSKTPTNSKANEKEKEITEKHRKQKQKERASMKLRKEFNNLRPPMREILYSLGQAYIDPNKTLDVRQKLASYLMKHKEHITSVCNDVSEQYKSLETDGLFNIYIADEIFEIIQTIDKSNREVLIKNLTLISDTFALADKKALEDKKFQDTPSPEMENLSVTLSGVLNTTLSVRIDKDRKQETIIIDQKEKNSNYFSGLTTKDPAIASTFDLRETLKAQIRALELEAELIMLDDLKLTPEDTKYNVDDLKLTPEETKTKYNEMKALRTKYNAEMRALMESFESLINFYSNVDLSYTTNSSSLTVQERQKGLDILSKIATEMITLFKNPDKILNKKRIVDLTYQLPIRRNSLETAVHYFKRVLESIIRTVVTITLRPKTSMMVKAQQGISSSFFEALSKRNKFNNLKQIVPSTKQKK